MRTVACPVRLPGAPANAKSTDRRFGFVTTLTLREEEPESINDSATPKAVDNK
jgi:hypothetical protein